MAYKVTNSKGKKVFDENFKSKGSAQQAVVDTIRGASSSKDSLKYYKQLKVRKV